MTCICVEHPAPELAEDFPGAEPVVLEVDPDCPVHGGETLAFLDLLHAGKISEFQQRKRPGRD